MNMEYLCLSLNVKGEIIGYHKYCNAKSVMANKCLFSKSERPLQRAAN